MAGMWSGVSVFQWTSCAHVSSSASPARYHLLPTLTEGATGTVGGCNLELFTRCARSGFIRFHGASAVPSVFVRSFTKATRNASFGKVPVYVLPKSRTEAQRMLRPPAWQAWS